MRFALRQNAASRCSYLVSVVALLTGAMVWPAFAARPPEPVVRVPLAPMGYQPIQTRYLTAGGTMFTVNFVDPTHLLATWSTRSLLTRLPDAEPDDEDRNVEAVLLELPSAKILARTTWRMRDHRQYLWPLGGGHFLLRLRNDFFSISPLEDLAVGRPFERHPVLETKRTVGLVFISPDHEIVTIETLPPAVKKALPPPPQTQTVASTGPVLKTRPQTGSTPGSPTLQPRPDTSIQVNFYRIGHRNARAEPASDKLGAGGPEEANGHIFLVAAGAVRATNALLLPMTGDGYLDVVKESAHSYFFDFAPYEGKRIELPAFDTSCYPRAFFVSRSAFITFGCRGSDDRQELGYFNLHGDHPWASTLANRQINASIVPVPEAGRFVLGRTLINGVALDLSNIVDAEIGDQEVTVIQAHDGRQLLKILPTPVQRAGQNFDLAPDGLSLAVFRAENIEVYRLPPLSARDQKEIATTITAAPPPGSGLVRISGRSAKDDTPPAPQETSPAPVAVAGSATSAPASVSPVPPAPVTSSGDTDSTGQPRKPPSLYDADHPKAPN